MSYGLYQLGAENERKERRRQSGAVEV
jgi:hypothetical protein